MKTKITTTPAEFVKGARLKLHLTQAELGKLTDKSRSSIAKYENKSANPPGDFILSLVNLLKATNHKF